MKKNLLLIAALMLMAAGAMAQDIYLGVTRSSGSYKALDIYKNGGLLYSHEQSTCSFDVPDMIAGEDGNIYYLGHRYIGSEIISQYTDVWKLMPDNTKTRLYDCPTGQGINLRALAYYNGDVYACGSYHHEDGHDYNYITKNDAIFYQNEDDGYDCEMMDITVVNGDVFTCGGEAWSEGGGGENYSFATVYKNGELIADAHGDGNNYSYAYGIAQYNDVLYISGKIQEGGVWKGVIWKTYADDDNQTLSRIATISDSESKCGPMSIEAGSIYVSYVIPGVESGVWKYNTFTDDYGTYFSYHVPSATSGNIIANNHGVYTAANGESEYWLDGESVSVDLENSGSVSKIAIKYTREYNVYNLPFYDSFEGDTYYDEWFAYDYDHENGYYASYWDRFEYADDEYAVSHRWGCDETQEADFVSPAINIPAGYSAKLGFYVKVDDLEDFETSAIYIMEDPGVLLTKENYASLSMGQEKIWDMEDHTSELIDREWKHFYVDIPEEYLGKAVNIVFFYRGDCAHRWTIDDIEVEQGEPVAIKNVAEELQLSVMPNPASDFISITGVDGIEDITIYNTIGQVVKTAQVSDGETISIEGLSQGVYMLKSEKSAQTVKFVVE